MVVRLVVVRGEEGGAAFGNGEVKIIFSEVVLKGGKVCVCVGFHGGDVCASGYDVDVVGVLGESCVGIGGKRNVVHVVVEEDGRDDRALWDAKVDVSVGREGVLEEDLLLSAMEVVTEEFCECV